MYIPNNDFVFTAAYSGALAGMGASNRIPTSANPVDYVGITQVAGAFAQRFDTLWGVTAVASLEIETISEICEAVWQNRAPQITAGNLDPLTYTSLCQAVIAIVQSALSYYASQGIPNPPSGGGGGTVIPIVPFGVNSAGADLWPDGSKAILRTGSSVNPAGAYNGGGTGNKAIMGAIGFNGMAISQLLSISYTFTNQLGPGGPFFIPPGGPSVTTPYCNLLVDFDGAGDLRVLSLMDDSLNAAITAAIGSYMNNGSNVLTYSWDSTKDVLIVNAPPNPVPGGVVPNVSVGAAWPENSYKWTDLIAANPAAILVDAFPANAAFFPTGDGGMPVGAAVPAILIVSGDSGNVVKSGKTITALSINGNAIPL